MTMLTETDEFLGEDTTEAQLDGTPDAGSAATWRRPTREEVIEAIQSETECTFDLAASFVDIWCTKTMIMRVSGFYEWHPTNAELAMWHASIMDLIMPDDTPSMPKSAHDLLERHLLHTGNGEMRIMHRKSGNGACQVALIVDDIIIELDTKTIL